MKYANLFRKFAVTGTFNKIRYIISADLDNNKKYLIPAEYCNKLYGLN